jgi:hypothetical protein
VGRKHNAKVGRMIHNKFNTNIINCLIYGIIFAAIMKKQKMKKNYLLGLGAALILLTSCGPKRLGCHGRRYCEAPKQAEQQIDHSYKKDV